MSAQDAQDIVQMNSLSGDIPVVSGGKNKNSLLWIVLGCVVVGVGLGVFVYQKTLTPTIKSSPTPRATVQPVVPASPIPSPIASPAIPATNAVTPVANTITFPKKGKIRVFHTLNNIQLVLQLTIGGVKKTITLPNKPISATIPANYADSSFEVEAGSTATFDAYLNTTSGPKLRGWIPPMDVDNKKECGVPGGAIADNVAQISYIKTLLAEESIYSYQCWEDDDVPSEFNDVYIVWTYAPSVASSPTATPSVAPSASVAPTPSPSPSASVKASIIATASVTPTPSARAAMPDTTEGVPVTGVFEVTVGTISVGLILLLLGLVGMLIL